MRAAYARGDLCVGAFSWGELIGYCWFAPSAAPHMDRAWIDFPPDVVYTYKSYVRPPCRGRMSTGTSAVFRPALCRRSSTKSTVTADMLP